MRPRPLDYARPQTAAKGIWSLKVPWYVSTPLIALGVAFVALALLTTGPSHPGGARIAAAKTDLKMLADALDEFQVYTGRYPTDAEGLAILIAPRTQLSAQEGPYVRKGMPCDPWGRMYIYHRVETGGIESFRLLSAGPDGQEGTRDDVAFSRSGG